MESADQAPVLSVRLIKELLQHLVVAQGSAKVLEEELLLVRADHSSSLHQAKLQKLIGLLTELIRRYKQSAKTCRPDAGKGATNQPELLHQQLDSLGSLLTKALAAKSARASSGALGRTPDAGLRTSCSSVSTVDGLAGTPEMSQPLPKHVQLVCAQLHAMSEELQQQLRLGLYRPDLTFLPSPVRPLASSTSLPASPAKFAVPVHAVHPRLGRNMRASPSLVTASSDSVALMRHASSAAGDNAAPFSTPQVSHLGRREHPSAAHQSPLHVSSTSLAALTQAAATSTARTGSVPWRSGGGSSGGGSRTSGESGGGGSVSKRRSSSGTPPLPVLTAPSARSSSAHSLVRGLVPATAASPIKESASPAAKQPATPVTSVFIAHQSPSHRASRTIQSVRTQSSPLQRHHSDGSSRLATVSHGEGPPTPTSPRNYNAIATGFATPTRNARPSLDDDFAFSPLTHLPLPPQLSTILSQGSIVDDGSPASGGRTARRASAPVPLEHSPASTATPTTPSFLPTVSSGVALDQTPGLLSDQSPVPLGSRVVRKKLDSLSFFLDPGSILTATAATGPQHPALRGRRQPLAAGEASTASTINGGAVSVHSSNDHGGAELAAGGDAAPLHTPSLQQKEQEYAANMHRAGSTPPSELRGRLGVKEQTTAVLSGQVAQLSMALADANAALYGTRSENRQLRQQLTTSSSSRQHSARASGEDLALHQALRISWDKDMDVSGSSSGVIKNMAGDGISGQHVRMSNDTLQVSDTALSVAAVQTPLASSPAAQSGGSSLRVGGLQVMQSSPGEAGGRTAGMVDQETQTLPLLEHRLSDSGGGSSTWSNGQELVTDAELEARRRRAKGKVAALREQLEQNSQLPVLAFPLSPGHGRPLSWTAGSSEAAGIPGLSGGGAGVASPGSISNGGVDAIARVGSFRGGDPAAAAIIAEQQLQLQLQAQQLQAAQQQERDEEEFARAARVIIQLQEALADLHSSTVADKWADTQQLQAFGSQLTAARVRFRDAEKARRADVERASMELASVREQLQLQTAVTEQLQQKVDGLEVKLKLQEASAEHAAAAATAQAAELLAKLANADQELAQRLQEQAEASDAAQAAADTRHAAAAAAAAAELDAATAALSAQREEWAAAQKELQQVQQGLAAQVATATSQHASLIRELSASQQKHAALAQELSGLREEHVVTVKSATAARQEVESAAAASAQLKAQLDDFTARNSALSARATLSAQAFQTALDRAAETTLAVQQQAGKVAAEQLREVTVQLQAASARDKVSRAELESAQSVLVELHASAQAAATKHAKQLEKLEAQHSAASAKRSSSAAGRHALHAAETTAAQSAAAVVHAESERDAALNAVVRLDAKLTSAQAQVQQLSHQAESMEQHLRARFEAAVGERLAESKVEEQMRARFEAGVQHREVLDAMQLRLNEARAEADSLRQQLDAASTQHVADQSLQMQQLQAHAVNVLNTACEQQESAASRASAQAGELVGLVDVLAHAKEALQQPGHAVMDERGQGYIGQVDALQQQLQQAEEQRLALQAELRLERQQRRQEWDKQQDRTSDEAMQQQKATKDLELRLQVAAQKAEDAEAAAAQAQAQVHDLAGVRDRLQQQLDLLKSSISNSLFQQAMPQQTDGSINYMTADSTGPSQMASSSSWGALAEAATGSNGQRYSLAADPGIGIPQGTCLTPTDGSARSSLTGNSSTGNSRQVSSSGVTGGSKAAAYESGPTSASSVPYGLCSSTGRLDLSTNSLHALKEEGPPSPLLSAGSAVITSSAVAPTESSSAGVIATLRQAADLAPAGADSISEPDLDHHAHHNHSAALDSGRLAATQPVPNTAASTVSIQSHPHEDRSVTEGAELDQAQSAPDTHSVVDSHSGMMPGEGLEGQQAGATPLGEALRGVFFGRTRFSGGGYARHSTDLSAGLPAGSSVSGGGYQPDRNRRMSMGDARTRAAERRLQPRETGAHNRNMDGRAGMIPEGRAVDLLQLLDAGWGLKSSRQ